MISLLLKGVSADADPHYQKLYGRVTDVCSNRRGQPNLSAMKEPRPGRNPSLIRFASPSGKYAYLGERRRPHALKVSKPCGPSISSIAQIIVSPHPIFPPNSSALIGPTSTMFCFGYPPPRSEIKKCSSDR